MRPIVFKRGIVAVVRTGKIAVPRTAFLIAILPAISSCEKELKWSEIGRVDDGVLYIAPAAHDPTATTAKRLALIDFQSPQAILTVANGKRPLSATSQHEIDCGRGQLRMLSATYYSGRMGKGEIVSATVERAEWKPVVPGTMGKSIWDATCGKS